MTPCNCLGPLNQTSSRHEQCVFLALPCHHAGPTARLGADLVTPLPGAGRRPPQTTFAEEGRANSGPAGNRVVVRKAHRA